MRTTSLLIVVLISLQSEVLGVSIANFWITQHDVVEVGSNPPSNLEQVPRIHRLTGSGTGSFYVWARPVIGMNLVNWSLDVTAISSNPTNPSVIVLTNSWVAPFNQTLNSVPSGPNSLRRWEYTEQPAATVADEIADINGFSLFGDEGVGIGIGAVNLSHGDPYYHAGAWLLARIDYEVGTSPGESEIFLQIGSRGMSHCSVSPCIVSSTAETAAVFGALTDEALNAGPTGDGQAGQRNQPSLTLDATFIVSDIVTPRTDFDGNQIADSQDLKIWQGSYGRGGGGDADGDGDTDGRDFLAWQRLFNGSASSVGNPGDFDGDSDVDGRDFLHWQRNPSIGNLTDWQANYGSPSLAEGFTIPEPNALLLMFLAVVPRLLLRGALTVE